MKLNGEWQCTFTRPGCLPQTIRATVPGCLHTDLQAAGIVGDFFYRDNAESVQWIEDCNAVYTKRFTLTEIAPNSVLCFYGLDVYCDIFLNGKKIGSADDMFIPHRFAVENDLQVGENLLEVCFRSPIKEVADKPQGIGAFTTERLNTRRMQCTYGWDWVARFVTMGICDDVVLESVLPNSPDQVYVYTACVSETTATVAIDATFQNLCGREQAVFTVTDPSDKTVFSKSVPVAETVSVTAEISKACLWYPVGYGEQPLYRLKICAGGTEKQTTFGIRTVKIEETVDQPDSVEYIKARELQKQNHLRNSDKNETTSSFRLLVNDTPIFCQGGNWVPSEPFYSAEDPQKIRHLVRMARDGGVNMLRVWGGGCFEKQAFYDACDEYGILVTQDLLMACGIYPEEDPDFIEKMTAEAETAALKLRNHPCLVWWAGDNENSVLGQLKNGEFSGNISSLYAGEKVLRRLDPTHRYFLSSPYGGKPYTSATVGTTHNTSFLGDWFDFIWDGNTAEYRQETEKYLSRFMDEQPAFGASFASSMKKFLEDEDIYGSDEAMLEYHCQSNPDLSHTLYEYAKKAAEGFFGRFTDAEDKIYKLQLLQIERVRISFELYRRNQWFSSGMIYWMYNDCWPTSVGWSLVDYYGNPKPAYYAFKRCAKPVIASVSMENGTVKVFVCVNGNDDAFVKGRLYLYNVLSGEETTLADFENCFSVGSNEAVSLDENSIAGIKQSQNVLLCDIESAAGTDRAVCYQNNYQAVPFEKENLQIGREDEALTVSCGVTVPCVILDEEKILSDNCFFMKKNETVEIRIL